VSRDSKIGLLVATAFILVVGLLLSDHVTVTTREPQARLVERAKEVQSSLRLPRETPAEPEPRPAEVPPQPEPADPEPIQLAAVDQQHAVPHADDPADDAGLDIWDNATPEPVADAEPADELARVAAANGEELEPAVDSVADVPEPAPERAPEPAGARMVGVSDYEAKPGDSLSKIAARVFGRDSAEARAKIVALNPDLTANPDLIVVGRTYRIPATPADAAAVRAPEPARRDPTTYTVKPNDNLWRIAARTLGDGNRAKEIARLNRDVLDDPDNLSVGMVLRLPS